MMFAKIVETENYGQVLLKTNTSDNDDYVLEIEVQAPEESSAAYMKVSRGLKFETLDEVNEWFAKFTLDQEAMDELIDNSLKEMYNSF